MIRVMPNTPMVVGEGCTVFCPGNNVTEEDLTLIKSILEVTGVCELIPEKLINAVSAISSSGPAFVRNFYFMTNSIFCNKFRMRHILLL